MSQIRWLSEALADVERLHAFLSDKSPEAAARVARIIINGTNLLSDSPEAGRRMLDETERRELFLPFGAGAYVLRYRIEGNIVVVIRVWHSRENRTD